MSGAHKVGVHKVGDRATWNSHGGTAHVKTAHGKTAHGKTAHGKIVRLAHEDGEIGGFHSQASKNDPRYILETEDGKHAAHKADAPRKG